MSDAGNDDEGACWDCMFAAHAAPERRALRDVEARRRALLPSRVEHGDAPPEVTIDPKLRPFVIVNPRAGASEARDRQAGKAPLRRRDRRQVLFRIQG